MNLKLSQKDKKTIKLGGVGLVAVIVIVFGLQGFDRWKLARDALSNLENKLDTLNISKDRNAVEKLRRQVPDFNMPIGKEEQRFRFRDSIEVQLRAAGINSGPLLEQTSGKSLVPGYDLLRWKSTGACSFSQLLNLLASMKENPYLVGVEELRIKVTTPQQQRGVTTRSTTASAGRSSATSSSLTPSSTSTQPAQPAGRGGQQSGRQTSYELVVSTLAKTR